MKKTFQELADGEKLTAEKIANFFGWPEKTEGRLWKTLPLNLTTIQWKIFLPGL